MPTFSLPQLADLVDGTIVGSSTALITNALPLSEARDGCITLADSAQQAQLANQTQAVAVVVSQAYPNCQKPLIVVANLHTAFTDIVLLFRESIETNHDHVQGRIAKTANIDPSAAISDTAVIGERTSIGQGCKIGQRTIIHSGASIMANCQIGDDCELFPGVVMYANTRIGNRVLIHANAVLGAYGFGYRQKSGQHIRTAQLGWVEVEDDVEIGAGTSIDRGTYGSTRIGRGTKIDNQVQIGHNCHIGQHNLICAQVGIAGSCTTGNYVVMGGQVGLADHLHIGDGAMIGAQAGLMSDVPPGEVVLGSPAGPRKQRFMELAALAKLPEMRKEFRELVSRVEQLESQSVESSDSNQRDAA